MKLVECEFTLSNLLWYLFKVYWDFCEDVEQQGQHRQVDADSLPTESLAQVFRHSVHAAGCVHGYEHPAEQDQYEHCIQLEDPTTDPGRRSCPRKTDEVTTADVAGEQGCSNLFL